MNKQENDNQSKILVLVAEGTLISRVIRGFRGFVRDVFPGVGFAS